jgi:hypothetical protein
VHFALVDELYHNVSSLRSTTRTVYDLLLRLVIFQMYLQPHFFCFFSFFAFLVLRFFGTPSTQSFWGPRHLVILGLASRAARRVERRWGVGALLFTWLFMVFVVEDVR